jgi:hypothetical protein
MSVSGPEVLSGQLLGGTEESHECSQCGQPVSGTEFKWKLLFYVLHTDRSRCAALLQAVDVPGSHEQVKSVRKQYQPVSRNNTPRITSR